MQMVAESSVTKKANATYYSLPFVPNALHFQRPHFERDVTDVTGYLVDRKVVTCGEG